MVRKKISIKETTTKKEGALVVWKHPGYILKALAFGWVEEGSPEGSPEGRLLRVQLGNVAQWCGRG